MNTKYLTETARIANAYSSMVNEGMEKSTPRESIKLFSKANIEESKKKCHPKNESFIDDGEIDTDSFETDSDELKDNKLKEAIAEISDIASRHNARIGSKYDGGDGEYAILILVINDPNKTPGVGFNMNYIMGVGYSIEQEMKKSGINGFVGAGGYLGCSTKIHLSKNEPFLEKDWEEKDDSVRKMLFGKQNESAEDVTEYNCYVIADYGDGWKIDSGWESKDDALDRTKDQEIPKTKGCKIKIVGSRTLSKFGLDASKDGDWMKGLPKGTLSKKECLNEKGTCESKENYFNRATGFYDRPRRKQQIEDEFNGIEKERVIGYDKDGSPIYVNYDKNRNVLWANANDEIVEMEFDKERDLDWNLSEFRDKIVSTVGEIG